MADLRFDVSAETRAATAALGSFAQDVQKKLVNAVRALPAIEITADSTDAEKDMKRLRDELAELANKKVGIDISAEDALGEMQRLQNELRELGGSTTEVGVRADVDQASRALGDVESEVRRLNGMDAEVEVVADTEQAEQEVSGFGDAAKVGLAAAGAAAGAIFSSAVSSSMEFGTATAQLQAQLGLTATESQRYGDLAGSMYANAYGESIGEVGNALRLVVQNVAGMADATDVELEQITTGVLNLASTMEIDLAVATNAVGQMIRNGIAKDGVEALDLLNAGAQSGADRMGDLAEVFSEYGETIQTAGLDGATAMGLLGQALDAGAWSSDLVVDSWREFGIIAQSGSEAATEAFQAIGLDGRQMGEDVAAGGERSVSALDKTLDALRLMPPSAERSQIAVALFGTKAEELGDALFAMDPSEAAARLGDFAGSAERADAAIGGTAAAKVTALQREYEMLGASLIETEGPLGEVSTMVAAFGPMAVTAAAAVAPLILALKMGGVVSALTGVSTAAAGTGAAAGAAAAGGGAKLLSVLGKVGGLAGVVGAAFLIDEATNQGLSDLLNTVAGLPTAAERARAGIGPDFWSQTFQSPAAVPGDMNDIRNIGQTVETLRQDFRTEVLGIKLPALNVDMDLNPQRALEALDRTLVDVNNATATVNINGNDTGAGFALRRILDEIAGGAETIMINGEPMPALDALNMVKGQISAEAGELTINGNTGPAGEILAAFMGEVAATRGAVTIGADPVAAQGTLVEVQAMINSAMGTVTVNGNTMPADQSLGAVLAAIDSGAATVTINGNEIPAGLALTNIVGQINAGAGTVLIDGQSVPAGEALAALIQTISSSKGTATIDGQPTPAYNALSQFLGTGNRSITTPQVNAQTAAARNQVNSFIASFQGRTIDLRVSTAGRLAAGGVVTPEATRATYYARGGVDRPMKAMPVGVPAVAQPGMLRVFGDRSDVNESYIPWKRSSRSVALLGVTADALGFELAPKGKSAAWYAGGGVALSDPSAQAAAREIAARMSSGGQLSEDWTWRGSSDNVSRWNDSLLDAYEASGSTSAAAWLRSVANPPKPSGTKPPPAAQAHVAQVVAAAPTAKAQASSATPDPVFDAAVKAELAALRRDIAATNYGPAQLAELRGIRVDLTKSTSPSALATASAAGSRADGGAW